LGWKRRLSGECQLKPHLVKSFKVSTDPNFAVKVEDIIGLYLDPPERALVLAVDEKSQIRPADVMKMRSPSSVIASESRCFHGLQGCHANVVPLSKYIPFDGIARLARNRRMSV
jgi:hypothetical protein